MYRKTHTGTSIKEVPAQRGVSYHNGDTRERVEVNKDVPKTQNFVN